MEKQLRIVAAIDFGTCNTRIAFARVSSLIGIPRTQDMDIFVMDNWENAPDGLKTMAPTSVLFNMTGDAVAYGFDAEDHFQSLKPSQLRSKYLFKYFKMELHKKNNFPLNHKLSSVNGMELTVIKVFSEALNFLATKLVAFIRKSAGLNVERDEIRWVLTVPAIWTPEARHVMRKAAYKAGLCQPSNHRNLVLALEPECAALFVRKQEDRSEDAYRALHYAVVDCGGGTVDIAYHSVEETQENDFTVSELHPPSGGPFGGTLIDRAFESEILEKVFGSPLHGMYSSKSFVRELKEKYTGAWLFIMKQFEQRKTILDSKADKDLVWLDLNLQFNKACLKITGQDVYDILEDTKVPGVSISSTDQMAIEAYILKSLYKEPIEKICTCLMTDLSLPQLSRVSALYMVGSFSKSEFLLTEIRKNIRSIEDDNIINPPDSQIAIVKGAIMYGIHPGIVRSRISPRSYGTLMLKPFTQFLHPFSKRVVYDGIVYCTDLYSEFIQKNQVLRTSDPPIKMVYTPVEANQTGMLIQVFTAPEKVMYTDDRTSKHLIDITVPMRDLSGGRNRRVNGYFEFTGTEIHIILRDENTGDTVDGVVEFVAA